MRNARLSSPSYSDFVDGDDASKCGAPSCIPAATVVATVARINDWGGNYRLPPLPFESLSLSTLFPVLEQKKEREILLLAPGF